MPNPPASAAGDRKKGGLLDDQTREEVRVPYATRAIGTCHDPSAKLVLGVPKELPLSR